MAKVRNHKPDANDKSVALAPISVSRTGVKTAKQAR